GVRLFLLIVDVGVDKLLYILPGIGGFGFSHRLILLPSPRSLGSLYRILQIEAYGKDPVSAYAFQAIRKTVLVKADPPDVGGCRRKQFGCEFISGKHLQTCQSRIGSGAPILGYFVFRAVFMPVVVLQLNSVILQSKSPGARAVFSYEERNADAIPLTGQ